MIQSLTLHNGAQILNADLRSNSHGQVTGYVLARWEDELVVWHVWQRPDGVLEAEAGNYLGDMDPEGAQEMYDQRRSGPSLPASLSMADGPFADILVREARRQHAGGGG